MITGSALQLSAAITCCSILHPAEQRRESPGVRGSLVLAALQKLRGTSDLNAELEEILAEQAAVKGQRAKNPWELFQNPALRWQLVSIVVLSSAMQLCGNDSVSSLCPGTWLAALGLNILAAGEEQIVCLSACGDL